MRGPTLRSLAAVAVLLLCLGSGTALAHIVSTPVLSPEAVVLNYFTIANQTLAGQDVADFALVYAPDATLTASNPTGATVTAHGFPAIEHWLKTWARTAAGLTLTETSARSPMPGMIVHYETATNVYGQVVAHCAHIFVVRNGMIISDDFITFNHEQPVRIAPVGHGPIWPQVTPR